MKILIVDDDPDARNILKLIIELHGHEAIEASDGLQGLEKAKANRPDLIISDILMPKMDGFQFLRETNSDKNLSAIPFVFYSSTYTGEEEIGLAFSSGAAGFIVKPKSPEKLWEELNNILSKREDEKSKKTKPIKDEEYLRKYSHVVSAKLEEKVKELEKTLEERKKAEGALKSSEEKFRTLFESANDAIFILDPEGNFIDLNSTAYERLGYTREEMLGKNVSQIDPPEFAVRVPERMEKIKKYGKAVFESAHVRKDGTIMPVEINTKIIDFENGKALFSIIRDITERKKAEEKLNQLLKDITKAKTEWEITFDNVTELIVLVDKDFRIVRCNKVFAEFSDKQINEIPGNKFTDIFPMGKEDAGYLAERIQKEESSEWMEVTTAERWFYLSHQPVMAPGSLFLYSVIIATDITALKSSEQKLMESEGELKKRVKELEKFYEMAVGRELKMQELKKEIKRLNEEFSRYKAGS